MATNRASESNSKRSKKGPRAIGVILARGGSKGIPLKNIKLLNGRPLLCWTLDAMRDAQVADEIWVSTDHDEIERVAKASGARVHRRGPEVSNDKTTSLAAIQEFLQVQKPECDVVIHAQATSPCITPEQYCELMDKYINGQFDSIFSVTRRHDFRWKEVGDDVTSTEAVNFDPAHRPRRQDWNGELYEDGAVYVTTPDLIMSGMLQGGKRVGYYEMPPQMFIDIDVPDDWPIAEGKVRQYGYDPTRHLQGAPVLKLLVCNSDGTLTNGQTYVSDDGNEMRAYHSRDAAGIQKVKQLGVTVKIVSSAACGAHSHQARAMGVEIAMGCLNKLSQVDIWRQQMGLDWKQVAYIGDDLLDKECIEKVGWGGTPQDAELDVRLASRFVSPVGGGQGAVGSFCSYLVQSCRLPDNPDAA